MHGRTGVIAEELERRKVRVVGDHHVVLIKNNLRNFTLHHADPFLGHTITVADEFASGARAS
jgi:hypothetical protein